MRLLRTTSFRLAALYVGLFAASALVLGTVVFLTARSALEQQMAARIETERAFLQDEFRAGGLDRLLAVVRSRGRGISALDYLVQDGASAHLAGEMPPIPALRPGWATINVPDASEDNGRPERVRARVSDLGGGVLLAVGDDLGRIADVEEAVATALAWTVGVAALLGVGGGVWLSRAFLSRVDAIARTAEAIIKGDLARRVPARGTGDDLDRLAGTLNRMLDRIGALMDSLRQVSSDVAHDLRTPLSRLYQRLEDARMHARSVPEYEAAVEGAVHEAEGLLDTFSALLRIAQVEGASPRAGFRDVDLSAVIEAVADAYLLDAEDAGHRLTAAVAPGIVVRGDQELLTQAAANLVENALRHTPPGARIGLRLSGDVGAGPCVVVEDDGPGVDPRDLPRLTHRFYRGERSRTSPGNGLGLSLVAAVTELHGAILELENAAPGLRAVLRFPPLATSKATCQPSHAPEMSMDNDRNTLTADDIVSKVPAVTLGFWIIKIFATTLGETGGDAVTMTLGWGYLAGTALFAVLLVVAVGAQIRATRFHPFLYWLAIVATTTVGTTMADFCDRSLGIGYAGGSALLFTLLMATLWVWHRALGSVSVATVTTPRVEMFYWATIMFSQTLGTALGDWMADDTGLGYGGGAIVFGAALAVVAALHLYTRVSKVLLFWAAFILTRPLGATVGDFLDKPVAHGGLALGRFEASAVLVVLIVACVWFIPQRAGRHPGEQKRAA